MRNVLVMFGILSLVVLGAVAVKAETVSQEINIKAQLDKPADAGNKICPVSNENIDPKLKATYEYKGKIYNFCCAMCVDTFKSAPEKYIKKVEEELEAQSKKGAVNAASDASKAMHEGMNH